MDHPHGNSNAPRAPRWARGLSGVLIGLVSAIVTCLIVLACASAWWAAAGVFPWRAAFWLCGAAWVISLGYGLRRAFHQEPGPDSPGARQRIP